MIERDDGGQAPGRWATITASSIAPRRRALFYANCAVPIDGAMRNLSAYFDRLMARPSYARALKEAEPYFHMFPMDTKPRLPMEKA